jgi:hypothetical protein
VVPSAQTLAAINQQTLDERRAIGCEALIADIRAHATDRTTPIGFGAEAPLTDIVMHLMDICVPLGLASPSDPEHARAALDTSRQKRFSLFSSGRASKGLSLQATDIDWAAGSGPTVNGPALPLAHALWGRPVSLDALSGPGLEQFRTALDAT